MRLPVIQRTAQEMLDELQAGWLEVVRIPIEGGYKRVVINQNAAWYRRFCADHISHRHGRFPRPRTYIKRGLTEDALRRMSKGNLDSIYARRLLPYLYQYRDEHRERRRSSYQSQFVCMTEF